MIQSNWIISLVQLLRFTLLFKFSMIQTVILIQTLRNEKTLVLLICGTHVLLNSGAFAQSPGKVTNFGIEGDVLSNFNLAGTWTATGSHDWFRNSNTSALGVIDTTGAATAYTHLLAGENYVFDRGMSVARYSVQDGYVLLDARYGRDYFGFSGSGVNSDLTTFASGAKNGDDPSVFPTNPGGSPVTDKADIIDAYVHMRRNGSVVNGASSSHLIAMMAASTVSNNGSRYFDVEFYCSSISYSNATGKFSNSGPASTGGHTAWTFNADGSIKSFGDMSVSFSFSGNSFDQLSIWIWVSLSNFITLVPQGFDFAPGQFFGASPGASYGYAQIQAKPGNSIQAWGAVNSAVTSGPSWGTCSETLGNGANNYDFKNYDIGALGEAAVDLTALGIDPALIAGQNPCNPPFRKILMKSRASTSFSSALKDFAGPYEFLDAPTVTAAVASPATLSCNISSVTLSAQNMQAGNYYHWSTSNGSIVSNPDSGSAVIAKPGKYYLQAAIYQGCPTSIDSVVVQSDTLKPVATASTSGMLNSNPASTVTLLGGDSVASKVVTPFGGSMGLTYSWAGPSGFNSTLQNPTTVVEGTYNLTVTEIRNGCKASASTNVIRIIGIPLPVKLLSFQGNINNGQVTLQWTAAQNEDDDHFEIEKTGDGTSFKTVASVMANSKAGAETYSFSDAMNSDKAYYRLKMFDKNQVITYSKTLVFESEIENQANAFRVINNPATDKLTLSFSSGNDRITEIKVYDLVGRMQMNQKINVYEGRNVISLPLNPALKA